MFEPGLKNLICFEIHCDIRKLNLMRKKNHVLADDKKTNQTHHIQQPVMQIGISRTEGNFLP